MVSFIFWNILWCKVIFGLWSFCDMQESLSKQMHFHFWSLFINALTEDNCFSPNFSFFDKKLIRTLPKVLECWICIFELLRIAQLDEYLLSYKWVCYNVVSHRVSILLKHSLRFNYRTFNPLFVFFFQKLLAFFGFVDVVHVLPIKCDWKWARFWFTYSFFVFLRRRREVANSVGRDIITINLVWVAG